MKTSHSNWLLENNACGVGMVWIKKNNIQSLEEVWNTCERGDWLLWLAQKLGVDKRKLTLCGALCAHTVAQLAQDPRSRNAVRIAFLWGRGKAADKELDSAWHKANRAFFDAPGSETAVWTARMALSAISAADNDSTKNHAAAAAAAASWAVEAAGGDMKANQARTAIIVKRVLTYDVMEKIKEVV